MTSQHMNKCPNCSSKNNLGTVLLCAYIFYFHLLKFALIVLANKKILVSWMNNCKNFLETIKMLKELFSLFPKTQHPYLVFHLLSATMIHYKNLTFTYKEVKMNTWFKSPHCHSLVVELWGHFMLNPGFKPGPPHFRLHVCLQECVLATRSIAKKKHIYEMKIENISTK